MDSWNLLPRFKTNQVPINTQPSRHKQRKSSFLFNETTTQYNTNHLRDALIGEVRQDVNRSAGSSGFIGSISFLPQAANWIVFLIRLTISTDREVEND